MRILRRLLVLVLAVCAVGAAASAALAETRVALVVGNSAYRDTTPLANPLNDARDVAAALKSVGFEVVQALDADKAKLDSALRAFADKLGRADVALFFYAGHGLQVGLQNYLLPVDAKLAGERDLEFETVKLDFVLRQMEIDRDGKTTIVILDACRDNPLARNLARSMGTRSASIGRGLAPASTGLGTFIAYSTQPGNVALDGAGRNSPFTAALVKHIGTKGRNLPATMIEVRKDVVAATEGKQVPWDHSALTGDFYFAKAETSVPAGSVAPAPAASNADLAALQERLKKLEEEAKKPRQVRSPPLRRRCRPGRNPAIATSSLRIDDNVRIDGLKYSEQREPSPAACRDACAADARCVAFQHGRRSPMMGQCHLFARVDGRQQDPNWRSGVRAAAAPQPQTTSAIGALKRLLPVKIDGLLSRKDPGFDIYDGLSIIGDQIKMSATNSSAACQAICRSTQGCIAATYNEFFRGKNVACMLYREITEVMKTQTSTMMIRSD